MDKPNASLSADRRGTLSIPDVQSFIADGNKYSLEYINSDGVVIQANGASIGQQAPGNKKRGKSRKDRDRETTCEEVMPSRTGTRSRPLKDANQVENAQIELAGPS